MPVLRKFSSAILLVLFVLSQSVSPVLAQSEPPVVRAVLFYLPTCSHCHKVITEDLPPLMEKHGEQLEILPIDISESEGHALYEAAIQRFDIPYERLGVPTLIVGEVVLVGSGEIPQQFPGLVEAYLSAGGMDWPDIPGLDRVLPADEPAATQPVQAPTDEPAPAPTAESTPEPPVLEISAPPNLTVAERIARDPLGNALAIVMLGVMLISLLGALIYFVRTPGVPLTARWTWLIPLLCLVGLGVASYLSYVELTQTEAVCGPVGDCNTVQQSEYARLFGILPVGVLGLAGYVAIILAWLVGHFGRSPLPELAGLGFLAMSAFGLLFSIYLTFLEPFVIGATCAWCLTSAVLMTVLFWMSIAPGKWAVMSLLGRKPLAGSALS
jgi:uncharacterized membrane protein